MAVSDKQGNEAHMSVSITEDYLLKYRDKKKPALDRAWLKKRTIHNEKFFKTVFQQNFERSFEYNFRNQASSRRFKLSIITKH